MLNKLKEYFEKRDDIAFAYLFGSAANGKIRKEGDIDIAIYFLPDNNEVEWEMHGKDFPEEARIGLELERLLNKDIDLVILNRARPIIADEILRKGTMISNKDVGIFLEFLCIVTDEAEYMREFINDYYHEVKSG